MSRLRPHAPLPDSGPSLSRLLGEVLTPMQAWRLLRHRGRLTSGPRPEGEGGLVIDIPGYFTPEVAMLPLRAYLRSLGHDVRGWAFGHNTSDVVGKVREFVPAVRELAESTGRPVTLVGWSLGGLVARETARDAPESVERIVTIGAPAIGGPRWTNARFAYTPQAVRRFQASADARARFPISRPVTNIWTRRDGIIDWRAQIDHISHDVEHVEVGSTHVGLAYDPDVWLATASALATPPVPAVARAQVREESAA